MKFPQQLYVRIEEDRDNSFLVATADVNDFATPGGELRAGLYQLVEEVSITAEVQVSVDKVDG